MESRCIIEEFAPIYQDAVISLITKIQREEFGIPITAEDQPDLHQIDSFYQSKNGNFWIALIEGYVVGSVALLDIGDGAVALRKMFVSEQHRGSKHGVAKMLIEKVFEWARIRGIQNIYLGTTSKFLAAHRFYEKNGFHQVQKSELPSSFPVMKVDSIFYQWEPLSQVHDIGRMG